MPTLVKIFIIITAIVCIYVLIIVTLDSIKQKKSSKVSSMALSMNCGVSDVEIITQKILKEELKKRDIEGKKVKERKALEDQLRCVRQMSQELLLDVVRELIEHYVE